MTGPTRADLVAARLKPGMSMPVQAGGNVMPVDQVAREVMDDLFDRIRGICSGWKQAWLTPAVMGKAKEEWLAEFAKAGVNSQELIDNGVRALRQSKLQFVPAPGVFVDWCFSTDQLGLPSLESAYREALANTHPAAAPSARWSHAAVYHAAARAGFSTIQNLSRDLGMKALEEQYAKIRREIAKGNNLPPVPTAALAAPRKEADIDLGNATLAALRAKMKGARHV
ncbi:replication P family protein [Pseudomonas sp. LA21]|uniref:replication protein P n=1 Tax=Pseudomonas sp. LA21 TaxID=2893373 RepID=UPI001FB617F2|nr:replication protein P [Pseudomonas sp. LA21]MCJ1887404.1 replication P family protein [Pseudomonas sp. LA21]